MPNSQRDALQETKWINLPITIHQRAILKEVSMLFHDADPAEYIRCINEILAAGLEHLGDPPCIGCVAASVTRVVTFLARLSDLTMYQREELMHGRRSEEEVYWNS